MIQMAAAIAGGMDNLKNGLYISWSSPEAPVRNSEINYYLKSWGVFVLSIDFALTVGEILQSSHFKESMLLAGASGLHTPVKWVHILEVKENIDQLVNGHELILTTGVSFTDEEMALLFLKQLIQKNVSGLCIELGTFFTKIPDAMIRLAEENRFPLIAFTKMTRFIDITHDLHTMIISRNAEMFSRVDRYYQQLNALLLSVHEFSDLLSFTHQYLNLNVIFLSPHHAPVFVPNIPTHRQRDFLDSLRKIQSSSDDNDFIDHSNIAGKPIVALNQEWGNLYFYAENRVLTEFDRVVLGKCAQAVAQDILRELYVKEKRSQEENFWVESWLKGECNENEIYRHLNIPGLSEKVSGYSICLIDLDTKSSSQSKLKELMIHTTIVARPVFEGKGFYLLSSFYHNHIAYALFDWGNSRTWIDRAKQALVEIKKNDYLFSGYDMVFYGIGKRVERANEIQNSLETAKEAVLIQRRLRIEEPAYDLLHIYRVIATLDKVSCLNDFVKDYLGPVIEYDAHNQSDLINTLKVFYGCNCSKQKTAEQLFVVRQTMYFRLQKIADLLGKDFMLREKRIAIEFALYAYDYINN